MLQTAVPDPVIMHAVAPTVNDCCMRQPQRQHNLQYRTCLATLLPPLLLLLPLLLLHLPHTATAKTTLTTETAVSTTVAVPTRECGSIDVRNECSAFLQLQGCTVINGYLMILLLPKGSHNTETCDYDTYIFDKLREITDFLIFYDVKGLTSIRDMFPNLTVIRGRRLFLNYALSVSNMPDLETLEFRSLVAIQRGNVYVGTSPKLCHLNKINWDRLTLAPGENHIFPVLNQETCAANNICAGCGGAYCWSNMVCQKFENDNVANMALGSHHCAAQCLGGCNKERCVVCRGLTDHGDCVEHCPADKYLLEHYQRCYTQQECIEVLGSLTHGHECVSNCPSGFKADRNTSSCVPCTANDTCTRICHPRSDRLDYDTILNLADAEYLHGCEVFNGSLVITIRNAVNERDLLQSFSTLREIRGHLKIYRSLHLTSLKFLKNITKIVGNPLESNLYAMIIYDNEKLKDLWQPKSMELEKGGIYVHRNNKLCNRYLREFQDAVIHDKSTDSIQTSDQEVLCDPAKLALEVQVLSHNAFRFAWRKDQTSDEVEVLYRPVLPEEKFEEESELDSNVCTRINWQRHLVFPEDLQENGTHYSIRITDLQPYTQYACLIKTFGENSPKNARSPLQLVRTLADKPATPLLLVNRRTDTSLMLQLRPPSASRASFDYYRLEVFEHKVDERLLDTRNYCTHPALLFQEEQSSSYGGAGGGAYNEDYDDCCARQEQAAEDHIFVQQMAAHFACTLDTPENCNQDEDALSASQELLQSLHLAPNVTNYTLQHLERYRLYTLQLQACSATVGCGAHYQLSERTNYSTIADRLLELRACRAPASLTNEYHVEFSEPQRPNGMIVAYVIHYRVYVPAYEAYESHINCVTRRQHAAAHQIHVARLNTTFTEVAVRVQSLAGDVFSHWVNVTLCASLMKNEGIGGAVILNTAGHTEHSSGVNVFLVCFLLGAGGTLLWICYKRRYWRRLPDMRRYLPLQRSWRTALSGSETLVDDRQTLVDGFERVRFHNNADDDQKYLE